MKKGTDLQELYDMFFAIVQQKNMSPSYIYSLIKPAIAKNYRQFRQKLKIILTDNEQFEGYFTEEIDYDILECLALQMAIDYRTGKDLNYLLNMRNLIGTKDFNKLPDKTKELQCVQKVIADYKTQLEELKSNMNTYVG